MNSANKILILGGITDSIINFRYDLIKKLIELEYEVYVIAKVTDIDHVKKIKKLGIKFIDADITNNKLNIISDFKYFFLLRRSIKNIKPNKVLAYTMKPVIYSGLVLNFFKNIEYYPLLTGLGFVYNSQNKFIIVLKFFISFLLKIALKAANKVIVQNKENGQYLVSKKIIKELSYTVVNGSGVNSDYFSFSPMPNMPLSFLMVSRIRTDKGIIEYIKAAKIIKSRYPHVKFILVGDIDKGLNENIFITIKKLDNNKVINYLGYRKDIKNIIIKSHIFVLPSYHEGMPKSVLEAMSIGRAILTTNIAGCNQLVINGSNGFLVPPKNHILLAEKMEWLINNNNNLNNMGLMSRKIIKEKFEQKIINKKMVDIING
tara:strand:+ start:9518 stop:10639 length:1122 start_codon:yes stop_codon:yes gene_type:complete